MKPGDLVRYWFARKYPVFGTVLNLKRLEGHRFSEGSIEHPSYLYTIDILNVEGMIECFDVYEGDTWEVINEAR